MRATEIQKFVNAVVKQDAEQLRSFFDESAYVNWHCTNEQFTVEEYIRVNCEYPGDWDGEIERVESVDNLIIIAAKVYSVNKEESFHVVSFIRIQNDKIISLDEYWGDDGKVPQWRLDKKIGNPIK